MRVCIIFLSCVSLVYPGGPRVNTRFGPVVGTYKTSEPGSRTFSAFEGIQYGLPPTDSLRFQPPRPSELVFTSDSPLTATKCGNECPQLDRASGDFTGDEDCLYLNVFSSETVFDGESSLPVMVWVHGGGFQFGSASSEVYGPERILEEDVVLVTINYRLGALGFLTSGDQEAPPNVGLLDQRLALGWVRNNIRAFGGDPDRVTLLGESAGAVSVMAHLASPGSQGLFHRAIAMSGVWGEAPFLHLSRPPAHYSRALAARLGCQDLEDTKLLLTCLRSKDAKQIVTESQHFATFDFIPEPFIPVVDDWAESPFLPVPLHEVWTSPLSPEVPLMIGGNKDDGVLFLLQFLKDEKLFARVNDNLSTELPALLLGVDPDVAESDEGETATAQVLLDSYLPGAGTLSSQVSSQMVRLFTDLHFLSPIDKVVREMANTTERLYYYNYQHQGSFTLPMAYGFWESYGVSHVDELFLLFRVSQVSGSWLGDLSLQTPEDFTVSRKLVKLWTNFAKTGKPTEDDLWSSVQEQGDLKYAVLDAEDIRMDYPEEFRSKMELVQGMMKLARTHRAFDMESHPALRKVREIEMKNLEEEWDLKRAEQMEEISEKQKKWHQSQNEEEKKKRDEELEMKNLEEEWDLKLGLDPRKIDIFDDEEEEYDFDEEDIDEEEYFEHDEL